MTDESRNYGEMSIYAALNDLSYEAFKRTRKKAMTDEREAPPSEDALTYADTILSALQNKYYGRVELALDLDCFANDLRARLAAVEQERDDLRGSVNDLRIVLNNEANGAIAVIAERDAALAEVKALREWITDTISDLAHGKPSYTGGGGMTGGDLANALRKSLAALDAKEKP